MLDTGTKRRVDTARDILVGKIPNPQSQVEQITIALIYKFMDDMDSESEDLGGEPSFFIGEYEKYGWRNIFSPSIGGFEMLNLYSEAIQKMAQNPHIPQLFRNIFKNAFLPYRDPETLKSFLKIINDFSYDHSEKLGDAFEYLLSVLGSQGDAGQFRTPRHIIEFMTALINPLKTETILDPACGTAGFLISAYKHILKNNSSNYKTTDPYIFEQNNVELAEITLNGKHYKGDKLTPEERSKIISNIKGYDISPDMVRLSLVNLYLHGFTDPHIYEYDTLTSEERWNEYYDVILANPPFMSPKGGIRPHKRFSIESKRSEVLFVDYMMEHLTPTGSACIIVPEGIIFQSGTAYKSLRKKLIEENYLVGVISLPSGVFNPYSGVKTSILWLDKVLAKKTDNIIFAKVENDGFDLGAQRRPIEQNDFPPVFKGLAEYRDGLLNDKKLNIENTALVSVVNKKKIAVKGEYNLSGDRYKEQQLAKDIEIPLVEVGEILEFKYGKPLKKENRKFGKYPVWGSNGIVGYHDEYLVRAPYIVVGRKGSAGALNYSEVSGYPIDTTFYIENNNPHKIDLKYAYYILGTLNLNNLNTQAGVPGLNRNDAYKLKIPLPPLPIQKEIVAEIESYQKIIDGARQVVENYKPIIDIDPDWEMVELDSVCAKITDGSHFSPKTSLEGFPYITVKDLKDGIIDFYECKRIDEKAYKELEKNGCNPIKNDSLFSKDGTVGKTAFINFKREFVVLSSLAIIRPNFKIIEPKYLYYIISTDDFIKKATENKTGVAIRRIVLKTLKTIHIPLPNREIQEKIIVRLEQEQKLIDSTKQLIKVFEQKIKDRIDRVWGE